MFQAPGTCLLESRRFENAQTRTGSILPGWRPPTAGGGEVSISASCPSAAWKRGWKKERSAAGRQIEEPLLEPNPDGDGTLPKWW